MFSGRCSTPRLCISVLQHNSTADCTRVSSVPGLRATFAAFLVSALQRGPGCSTCLPARKFPEARHRAARRPLRQEHLAGVVDQRHRHHQHGLHWRPGHRRGDLRGAQPLLAEHTDTSFAEHVAVSWRLSAGAVLLSAGAVLLADSKAL